MNQSSQATLTVLISLTAACAAICVAAFPVASPYAVAMTLTISLACTLCMIGETRKAIWVFSVGGVLVEIVGTNMAATRPVEQLTAQLLLATRSPFTMGTLALAWFLGGFVHGWQSLQRAIQLFLAGLWLLCAAVRCATVYRRCGEPVGALAITHIFPCCFMSAIMGYVVAFAVAAFIPCVKVARRLERAEDQLYKSHRSVAGLLANLSALRSLWDQLPESVRVQYTGTSTAPDLYKDNKGIYPAKGVAAEKHPAAGLCVVCFERPFTHAFVPCMHRCVCNECAMQMDAARGHAHACPICRRPSITCAQVFDA